MYSSICQLFELFLLAVFRSFSDVPLGDIVGETPTGGVSQPPQPQQPDQVGRHAKWPTCIASPLHCCTMFRRAAVSESARPRS